MIQVVDLDAVTGGDVTNLAVSAASVKCSGQTIPRDPFNTGLKLLAAGHNIVSTTGGISCDVQLGSGFVEIDGGTVIVDGFMGVRAGVEKAAGVAGDLLVLTGTRIEGTNGTFGFHARNMDFWLRFVTFDCQLGQHNLYAGGPVRWGFKLSDCTIERTGSWSEATKFVCRPGWEALSPWRSDWELIIERTTYANCNAGIVIQGAGCNTRLEQVIIRDTHAPIRIDNGLSQAWPPYSTWSPGDPLGPGRFWDHTGAVEGSGSANGGVVLNQVIVERKVGGSPELMRIGKEVCQGGVTWPHAVSLATTISQSGFYGQGSYLSIPAANTAGPQTVNPTPSSIDAYAASLGIDTTYKATVNQ